MKWEYRVQGPGPVTADRKIKGWTFNGKSVIVSGDIYRGADMPAEAEKVGAKAVIVRDAQRARRHARTIR